MQRQSVHHLGLGNRDAAIPCGDAGGREAHDSEDAIWRAHAGTEPGAAYAFDEESYGRFLPLGKGAGLALADADFSRHKQRFFTVQVKPS